MPIEAKQNLTSKQQHHGHHHHHHDYSIDSRYSPRKKRNLAKSIVLLITIIIAILVILGVVWVTMPN